MHSFKVKKLGKGSLALVLGIISVIFCFTRIGTVISEQLGINNSILVPIIIVILSVIGSYLGTKNSKDIGAVSGTHISELCIILVIMAIGLGWPVIGVSSAVALGLYRYFLNNYVN